MQTTPVSPTLFLVLGMTLPWFYCQKPSSLNSLPLFHPTILPLCQIFYELFYLIPTPTLQGKYHYPHFTDEQCKLRYFPLSSRNPQLRNLYSKSFSRKEAGQESEILADILSLTSPWGPWVPSPKVPRPDAILSQEIHFNGTAASPGQPLFPRSPRHSPCLLKSCSGFPPALRSPNVSPRASVPRPPFCPIRPGRFPEDGQRHSSRLYKGPEPWSCCEWSASSKVHKSLSSALVPDDNETNSSGEAVPSPSCHRSPAAWPSWEASAAPRFINRTQTLTFLAKMSVTTKWHGKNILKKQLMPSTTEVFISFLFQRFWQILMGIYLQGQSTDSETLSVTCTRI